MKSFIFIFLHWDEKRNAVGISGCDNKLMFNVTLADNAINALSKYNQNYLFL